MRAPAASAMAVAWGTPMPSTPAAGARVAGTDADEHADRAGAHEVQRGGVGGAAADDHGDVELADELLQVERLRSVFETCSADTTVPWMTRMSSSASRTCLAYCSTRCGVSDAQAVTPASLISRMRAPDQLRLDRLGVDLLHAPGGLLGGQVGDLLEQHVGVVVAGPEALEVEARRRRRGCRSRSRCGATARRPSPSPSPAARTGTRRAPR